MTRDGTEDDFIAPHYQIKDELLAKFRSLIHAPQAQREEKQDFIIELSSSEEEDSEDSDSDVDGGARWNSEDDDDEEKESDDDEQEPVPEDMEIQLEDEQEKIRAARAAVHKDGNEELLRDFNLAARIARQDGVAVAPQFAGASDSGFNNRKNEIYKRKLAALEAEKKRKATPKEIEGLFNAAGIEAMAPEGEQEGREGRGGRRRSARARRCRT